MRLSSIVRSSLRKVFAKKPKYQLGYVNLCKAKNVALLFDSQNQDAKQCIQQLEKELTHCKLTAFELLPKMAEPMHNSIKIDETCFSYLGSPTPKHPAFSALQETGYDILLDFTQADNALKNDFLNSIKCSTRVTRFKQSHKSYNLVFKLSDQLSNLEYINQAIYYLNNLNK